MGTYLKWTGFFALLIFAILVVFEALRVVYIMQPIDVSDNLRSIGLDGKILSSSVRDKLSVIRAGSLDASRLNFNVNSGQPDSGDVDLKVAGTEISVRHFAELLARTFGWTRLSIGGSLIRVGGEDPYFAHTDSKSSAHNRYRLTIRDDFSSLTPLYQSEGSIEELTMGAAVAILGTIDPVIAANHLRTGTPIQQIDAVAYALEGIKRAETHDASMFVRLFGIEKSLPRAYLSYAHALSSSGQYERALAAFDKSELAYADSNTTKERAYSADGKAYAVIERMQVDYNPVLIELAGQFLNQADKADPNYDSAQYHRIDLLKIKAEHELKDKGCKAISAIEHAHNEFNKFQKRYRYFAFAYLSDAVMMLKLASFLRFEGQRSSDCKHELQALSRLESISDELFKMALETDHLSAENWLQWGILAYQRQIAPSPMAPLKDDERKVLLDAAIERLTHATQLAPDREYPLRRLAYAIQDRINLDGPDLNDGLAERGAVAACRAFQLEDRRADRNEREKQAQAFRRTHELQCGLATQ